MSNSRHKDYEDKLPDSVWTYEVGVQIAALWDIRDELKRLNNLLACQNFLQIPQTLREIKQNTTKRKYARKVKK